MQNFTWAAIVISGLLITGALPDAEACHHEKLPDTWTEINPAQAYPGFTYGGLAPSCAAAPPTVNQETGEVTFYDPEFTFFVKGGKSNKWLVYFEGGGACWHPMNCLYVHTYNEQVTPIEYIVGQSDDPGILDADNDNNPFRNWNIVYIPYCTGDLHWGANDVPYPDFFGAYGGAPQTIRHRGFVNFQVVLKWMKDNANGAKKIFVAGSSAGGYGAIMNFPHIKEAFPRAKVNVLADASNGVSGGTFSYEAMVWNIQMPTFIPAFAGGYLPTMNLGQVVKEIAEFYPKSNVAQFTTAWDATQTSFYYIQANMLAPETWQTGWPSVWCDWNSAMLSLVDLADEAANYRYYIAPGIYHTILTSPAFYEEMTDGVLFFDWVRALAHTPPGDSDGPRRDVECDDCAQPIPCF